MPSTSVSALSEAIGANVARLRVRAGLTQARLAERVGIEPNYLQRIEYGRATPSLTVLVGLAEVLGSEVWRLCKPSRRPNPTARRPGRPRGRATRVRA